MSAASQPWRSRVTCGLALALGACAGAQVAPGAVATEVPVALAGFVATAPGVAVPRFEHAETQLLGGALVVKVNGPRAFVAAAPESLGLPRDFRRFTAVVALIDNGDVPATIEIAVLSARGRIGTMRELGARNSAMVELDLRDLPLATDAAAPFDVTTLRLGSSSSSGGARAFRVRSLALRAAPAPLLHARVDGFGQRTGVDWPGKAHGLSDLKTAALDEAAALKAMRPVPDRNAYGGWQKGDGWQETGFFSVERDGGGRFWFIDPAGRPFWSVGMAGVRTLADPTPVAGREFLFATVPARGGPDFRDAFLALDGREGIAFYRWNVLRKWGGVSAWATHSVERFGHWGFNTIGAFATEPEIVLQRRIPHVASFATLRGADVAYTPGGFPDVFDPRWPAFVDRQAADAAATEKDNPWLVGYLVDGEPRWQELRLLAGAAGTPLRSRFATFQQERGPGTDEAAFEGLYADTYFSTIALALKKHDPNHIYMGCHLPRMPPFNQDVVRAAGRHVDVLAINLDASDLVRADLDRWHTLSGGKPILIAAHHTALLGPRQLTPDDDAGAGFRALPAPQRGRHYAAFVAGVAAIPYVVGAHATAYADQPVTGRAADGDNQPIGFVDITDRPHDDLVTAAREVTARIYDLHAAAR